MWHLAYHPGEEECAGGCVLHRKAGSGNSLDPDRAAAEKTTVSRLASGSGISAEAGSQWAAWIFPKWIRTLMSLYSIVFQDVTLFDNTILENIRIGKKMPRMRKLWQRQTGELRFFRGKLPEAGIPGLVRMDANFSGGERQRISIARAFLKDAPIILLDEATASLDVDNETLIQSSLSKLIRNKTVLIIAHRMRTVANADQIVVLKDGRIAEHGSPKELMEQNGIFCGHVQAADRRAEVDNGIA